MVEPKKDTKKDSKKDSKKDAKKNDPKEDKNDDKKEVKNDEKKNATPIAGDAGFEYERNFSAHAAVMAFIRRAPVLTKKTVYAFTMNLS